METVEFKENATEKFREYLRIRTVHPKPDYQSAISFLKAYAEELGLQVQEVRTGRNTVLVLTWIGRNPDLKSVILNSHTDVVPVFENEWKHDPFAAVKEENGDIYGRGAQDCKCVGIGYLEAIRVLKVIQKQSFDRTIHMTFMPDEEIGGKEGMEMFIKTEVFKNMNAGFSLDEGGANEDNSYTLFYGERSIWWLRITCRGNPGHGSMFIKNTAAKKLQSVLDSFLDFRDKEEAKLEAGRCLMLGDVTTINLTKLEGGVANNVVPNEFHAGFDVRIAPAVDLRELEDKVKEWCDNAGDNVSYQFVFRSDNTKVTDTEDKWVKAITGVFDKAHEKCTMEICCGGTDSRYLREAGYPAIGFGPMKNTPRLLHDHNERLNEKVLLDGINLYTKIIPALANCS